MLLQAQLLVGDMILCVNREEMVGIDYETATNILKKTEGVINMWLCNPVRAGEKPAKGAPTVPGTGSASASAPAPAAAAPKAPKKPGNFFLKKDSAKIVYTK